ncbi:ACP S-malonyltransferase [Pseudomonas syringae]|uniref:ACP S-malonyltransferase n=1 Tax=Pseudomonas syringae TaxID=317 RepID=UPI00040180D3|nr:ACP S-malonyltransferase [Pseudomonas syringae]
MNFERPGALAIVFPGQGSQFPGMGLELLPRFREMTEIAETLLGLRLAELLEDAGRLADTAFTQPAVFVVSAMSFEAMRQDRDIDRADLMLGHSLGLFGAIHASGRLGFADTLKLVIERGQLMKAAGDGAMLAVMGIDAQGLEACLLEQGLDSLDIANVNGPEQTVLSGPSQAIERAAHDLQQRGLRAVQLNVSGAFHSRYMETARAALSRYVERVTFSTGTCPLISTTHGGPVPDTHLLEEIVFQLTSPVRWLQTIQVLRQRYSLLDFIEPGPGQVLTRLIAAIDAHHQSKEASR